MCSLLAGLFKGGNGGLFANRIGSADFREFSIIVSFEMAGLLINTLVIGDSSKDWELSFESGDIALGYVVGTEGILAIRSLSMDTISIFYS